MVSDTGAESLELFWQSIGLDQQGGIVLAEQLPQFSVGGHVFEYFLEATPDDRLSVYNKQQYGPLPLRNLCLRFIIPNAPKDALVREVR